MPVTIEDEDVVTFIDAHREHTFQTTGQAKPFTVSVAGDHIEYALSSGKSYKQPREDMERLLQQYAATRSLKPSDYHSPNKVGSRFSSYFAALMTAMQ